MKIIRTSNYNIESEAERVVAENIAYEAEAATMCDALNASPKRSNHDWFRVVKDDYILWRGMEELV